MVSKIYIFFLGLVIFLVFTEEIEAASGGVL